MTHELRSRHDAILIGIGTLLADDPSLMNRLAPGGSPRPVILDSRLRTPPTARVLAREGHGTLILTGPGVEKARVSELENRGARILELGRGGDGGLDLRTVLATLFESGIRSLMVEGGASVIASFLAAHLVDDLVITIAPLLLGGFNPFTRTSPGLPCLIKAPRIQTRGIDTIVSGLPSWDSG